MSSEIPGYDSPHKIVANEDGFGLADYWDQHVRLSLQAKTQLPWSMRYDARNVTDASGNWYLSVRAWSGDVRHELPVTEADRRGLTEECIAGLGAVALEHDRRNRQATLAAIAASRAIRTVLELRPPQAAA